MWRLRMMILLVFVGLTAACASDAPAKKTSRAESAKRAQAVKPAEAASEKRNESEQNPKGPIDLDMGDDEGGEIAIDRPEVPQNAATDIEGLASKRYEKTCKSVDDCQGLEKLDCDGEMACSEGQCVYACADEEELDEEGEFAEEGDDF